jgi:Glycosyl transferases group 1
MSRDYSNLRVLHLQVEFSTWAQARPWSYCVGLALEEGLAASGAQTLTLTSPWLNRAQEIIGTQRFDQVWIEIVHQSPAPAALFEWVASLAPVRIGLVGEGLQYTEADRARWPEAFDEVSPRKERVERILPYITHVVAVDEVDARDLTEVGLPSMWWPQAVPRRSIRVNPPQAGHRVIFGGTPYGKRGDILAHPSLQGLVAKPRGAEDQTMLPLLFDGLHQATYAFLEQGRSEWRSSLATYLSTLRDIRRTSFELYLDSLQTGCAVLNLPGLAKCYAGRVFEGMAAARPVISWDIPERPRNRALFEEGDEILLFNADEPRQLTQQIERVMRDSTWATRLADNARRKLEAFHTIEMRVQQILDWSTHGIEPRFN